MGHMSNCHMPLIPLTQGVSTAVDDEDFVRFGRLKWQVAVRKRTSYAQAYIDGKNVLLHRAITGVGKGLEVDHIDGDGLNNVRSNLRIVTSQQNTHAMQRKQNRICSSQYRGVSWNKEKARWEVYINCDGKRSRLGYFDSEHDAARAYNRAGFERNPEFFVPNFIVES